MKRPPPVRYEHTDNELHDVMVNIGLTRAEFARLLGVSRQTINTWLTGTKPSAVYEVIIGRMEAAVDLGEDSVVTEVRKLAKESHTSKHLNVSELMWALFAS